MSQRTNPPTDKSLIIARSDLVIAELADEVVILNLQNGVYYSLDPVGAYLWSLLATPRRVDDLCTALTDRYAVDEAQCRSDLEALLADLQAEGLIEIQQEPSFAVAT